MAKSKIFSKKGINKLVGIDSNYVTDALLGIIITTTIFYLAKYFKIVAVIGTPSVPQAIAASVIGVFIIKVVSASIFETVTFQEFILDFFDSKLKFPFFVAAVLSSLAFTSFHYFAYEIQDASAFSYVLVFMWGMLFSYIRYYTDSILAVISAHGTLNFIIEFILEEGIIIFK